MFRNKWFYAIASTSRDMNPVVFMTQGAQVEKLAADSLAKRGESL